MSRIGERMSVTAPRYLKHPAAGTGWWGDAKFMDAGTAHHLDSNLSVLANESVQHIGTSLGPGTLEAEQNGTFTGILQSYDDVPVVDPAGYTFVLPKAADLIAWDYRVSVCFGPYIAIQDRALPTGGYGPRKVRVSIHASTDASAVLYLLAALTASPDPPDQGTLVMATVAGTPDAALPVPTAGVEAVYDLDLESPTEVFVGATWTCRPPSARGPVLVQVAELYVWAGWYRTAAAAARIHGVTAYELR